MTTRGVADAAGVQAPTIYRLFGDKEGLLDAVAEHVMATYVTSKAVAVDSEIAGEGDPVDDLRAGWRAQIDFGLANPTLFALLSDPLRGRESPAARQGLSILAARVHRVARAGRLSVSEKRAVDIVHAAGTGAVLTILATPPADRDRGLADDLFDAVIRHIVVDTPARSEPSVVTSAIELRSAAHDFDALTASERALLIEWLDRISAPR